MSLVRMDGERFELCRFATDTELARVVAVDWLGEIEAANRDGRSHCVALSGGRITQKLFACVVEENISRKVSFQNVHFFWADERCVPPTDPESNFRVAQDLFFKPLNISESQVHRVRGEHTPQQAAASAETEARRIVPDGKTGWPLFDLIFLGMGEDGHVASLFPGAAEGESEDKVYSVVLNSPKPPSERVTLTYPVIAAARQVWVVASGKGKESALRRSLEANGGTPLGRALESRSHSKVFTDITL